MRNVVERSSRGVNVVYETNDLSIFKVMKGNRKEPVWEWQPKPLSDSELRAYIKEKISTDDRLKLYRSNNANANGGA